MDIRDIYDMYVKYTDGKNYLEALDIAKENGLADKIDLMVSIGLTKNEIIGALDASLNDDSKKVETRGRKKKVVTNPHYELFCDYQLSRISDYRKNELMDCVVGVCRSFVTSDSQNRSGLSPSKLKQIMTRPDFTKEEICNDFNVGMRQAGRYMKAAEVLISLLPNKRAA